MIRHASIVLSIIASCQLPILLFGAESADELKGFMASPNAQVRETAIKKFLYGTLGTIQGSAEEAGAAPTLLASLSDKDVIVKRFAANSLLTIAGQNLSIIKSSPASNGVNLAADPDARAALLKATSDPDDSVRGASLRAYACTYKLTPELENKIIAEFESLERKAPNRPSDKAAFLDALMLSGSPSSHAEDFLASLLDDPKWSPHVAASMAAENCQLSGAALEKLVGKVTHEKDPVNRGTYARAAGVYGKQAQPYLPQLKTALAAETDEVVKANIKNAIDRVNQ